MQTTLSSIDAIIASFEKELPEDYDNSAKAADQQNMAHKVDSQCVATTEASGGGYLTKIDALITDLESALGLGPGQQIPDSRTIQLFSSSSSLQNKKEKKQEKKQALPSPPPPPPAKVDPTPAISDINPTNLDLKVGLITKAWVHPESDKLFCEEIDIGEAQPRLIASGLRAFYSLTDMQDRMVVVMANLKGRNLGGFKSEGMVLCASNDDHTAVKFIDPPAGAKPGDQVVFPGMSGDPLSAAQMVKRKVLQNVLPYLKTDDKGTPGFVPAAGGGGGDDKMAFVPFTVEDVGVCSSPLPGASVA